MNLVLKGQISTTILFSISAAGQVFLKALEMSTIHEELAELEALIKEKKA
jgi:hypothetical protein